jgi:sugar lactone lactonase YvrE
MRLKSLGAHLVLLSTFAVGCSEDSTAPDPPASPPPGPAVPDGLWTVSGDPSTILRLSPAQLTGTGDRTPDTQITTTSGQLTLLVGVAFGADGRLWMASTGDARLLGYSPGALGTSGSSAASTVIALGGALSGPTSLAFDSAHRLWVANFGTGTLIRFDPEQLAAGGAPAPKVVLSGAGHPSALAFDASGSLWVSDYEAHRLLRYDTSQLSASGSPAPAAVLTASDGSLVNPSGLAFDDSGSLWVSNLVSGTVVAFGAGQLAATGSVAPRVVLSANAGSLVVPAGLAFDADGSLWVLGGGGGLVRFASASLGVTGSPVPAARLEMPAFRLFWSLAIWPGPPGLPLDSSARTR